MNGHVLDRPDSMDVHDHAPYDIFPPSGQSNGRYRPSSATSSVPSSYGIDSMYTSQSPFSDSIQQFHNPSPDYGLMPSYNNKPSPLTPNDAVGSIEHQSAFGFSGQLKDYSSSNGFGDLDRRMSSIGAGSYPSDFNSNNNSNDYNGMSVNPGLGLGFSPSSTLPPFHGRMSQDPRYPSSVIPPLSLPSHLSQNHTPDHLLQGVSPNAITQFREGGDLGSFMPPAHTVDFPLRMPGIVDMPVRMGPGGATDLQTFIRCVPSACR